MIYNQGHPVFKKAMDNRVHNMQSSVPDATDKESFFAKERYKLHQVAPDDGVNIETLKKYFSRKYGF